MSSLTIFGDSNYMQTYLGGGEVLGLCVCVSVCVCVCVCAIISLMLHTRALWGTGVGVYTQHTAPTSRVDITLCTFTRRVHGK